MSTSTTSLTSLDESANHITFMAAEVEKAVPSWGPKQWNSLELSAAEKKSHRNSD